MIMVLNLIGHQLQQCQNHEVYFRNINALAKEFAKQSEFNLIIVTGASRGLGKAIVERLSKEGEDVIGLTRLGENSDNSNIQCDVSQYLSEKDAAKKVKQMKKPLDAFINAAGVTSIIIYFHDYR